MKPQLGKDLLLKLGDDQNPPDFTTVAGMRSRTLSLNAATVDVTHAQSVDGWRELLAGAGLRQASVSGNGLFLSEETAQTVRQTFFAGNIPSWQVIIPGLGVIEGPFQITSLDFSGEFDGEITMALALESAGVLSFTGEMVT